ncbi:unnamed protein product [Toxocara canis]|uniref:WD_REPEATS_REGION domain-containing protein n=1 Tax=Toxocara canis TaxID=6265 RepID=A0A183V7U0_TOXCA|nr:unnamed protein product [Toxocara canis]
MKTSDKTIASMRPAKSFSDNQARINSLDFSADGLQMISSSDDDSIVMYDCSTGQKSRSVNSKKYGVDLIQFAHNTSNAIHCSTKIDGTLCPLSYLCVYDVIRYLSLHDNKYIRYFPGHQKKVVTLSMSPLDDMFLSGSLDKTIRLWDLRMQSCQGLMHVPSRPVAAFDPEGLIFAAGINSDTIKLYDLRSFDKVSLTFATHFRFRLFIFSALSTFTVIELFTAAVSEGKAREGRVRERKGEIRIADYVAKHCVTALRSLTFKKIKLNFRTAVGGS